MERARPLRILSCAGALLLVAVVGTVWGGGGQIVLDADSVEYDQARGFAVASGNVRMSRDMLRVFAPRVEYSADDQTVEAFSSPDGRVVLIQGEQRIDGDHLSLDMISGEGVLTNASGNFAAEKGRVFATGSDATVYRFETAKAAGITKGRVPKALRDRVYQWESVSTTTCENTEEPHYNLVSKRIVIIPGCRIVVARPKVYIGGRYILTYPFDYVIDLAANDRSQLMPQVAYESDKGVGISIGAPLMLGDVNARWRTFLWSEVDFEGALSLDYKATENITLFAEGWYSWDDDENEKRFRPQWGADYDFSGWTGRIWWSEAESVTVEKELGDTFEGTLWRKPEFTFFSPRWDIPGLMGSWQLSGVWGDYETRSSTGSDTVSIRRSGLGANYSGSAKLGNTSPFWGVSYWWYDYDSNDSTQKVLRTHLGLSWLLGSLEMKSTWVRKWVDGGSPMSWDDYSDSNAFYQRVAIPLGEFWKLTVRGGYDLDEQSLDEMYYRISYDNNCCYRVDIAFRDDRAGTNDWAGIVFVIDAFPSNPFFLGSDEIRKFGE
ncbi:MAG: LPS-assembly protein LptD [Thermovirga sp.]